MKKNKIHYLEFGKANICLCGHRTMTLNKSKLVHGDHSMMQQAVTCVDCLRILKIKEA